MHWMSGHTTFASHADAVAWLALHGPFTHGHGYFGGRDASGMGATLVPGLAGLTFLPPGYRVQNPATNTHYEMGIGTSYIMVLTAIPPALSLPRTARLRLCRRRH